MENEERDVINSPSHYKLPGLEVEAIDVVRSVLGPDKFQGFCRGNALKYLIRADRKNGTEDLEKAQKYVSWEIGSRKISGGGVAQEEPAAPEPEQNAQKAERSAQKSSGSAQKQKKNARKKQEKSFDMGKLRALHEGGWSVAKIADEMGVSQQTIYNKLKDLKA